MSFVSFSEQTVISVNSINQLIFVMETCCVFFVVGTELLNIIYMKFGLQMVKEVFCGQEAILNRYFKVVLRLSMAMQMRVYCFQHIFYLFSLYTR
jgi:hypothetical protein